MSTGIPCEGGLRCLCWKVGEPSALLKVPGFLPGPSPPIPPTPPLVSVLHLYLLCLGKLSWEVLGFQPLSVPLQDPLGLGHFVMQVKPFASCPDRSVAVVRIGTRKAVLHPQLLAGMGVEAQRPSSQPH